MATGWAGQPLGNLGLVCAHPATWTSREHHQRGPGHRRGEIGNRLGRPRTSAAWATSTPPRRPGAAEGHHRSLPSRRWPKLGEANARQPGQRYLQRGDLDKAKSPEGPRLGIGHARPGSPRTGYVYRARRLDKTEEHHKERPLPRRISATASAKPRTGAPGQRSALPARRPGAGRGTRRRHAGGRSARLDRASSAPRNLGNVTAQRGDLDRAGTHRSLSPREEIDNRLGQANQLPAWAPAGSD
jgi:hypothetical protein